MTAMRRKPETARILQGLKDFQRETVDYVDRQLYERDVKRFLIADEVGLGKTLVARGMIAKAIDRLWDNVDRIDIVYVCANRDIARQNVNRLNVTGERELAIASRMTLLPVYLHNLKGNRLNFVSFTPGTSLDLLSREGIAEERALIYHILRKGWRLGNQKGPRNLLQCYVGRENWELILNGFEDTHKEIDSQLTQAYLAALETKPDLRERFSQLSRKVRPLQGFRQCLERGPQHTGQARWRPATYPGGKLCQRPGTGHRDSGRISALQESLGWGG